MKQLKDYEVTEAEWRHIVTCFVSFYKNENKCSKECPMGWGDDSRGKSKQKINTQLNHKLLEVSPFFSGTVTASAISLENLPKLVKWEHVLAIFMEKKHS